MTVKKLIQSDKFSFAAHLLYVILILSEAAPKSDAIIDWQYWQ